jgi:predicted acyltransferase
MPTTELHPLSEVLVTAYNGVAGSQTGSRITAPVPVRGEIVKVGFMPSSLVASAMTLAVLVGNNASSVASSFTTVVTSTLGTFSSTLLYEGAVCSVVPAARTYVNEGDAIQFVNSGGNTSLIGATNFAVIRRV